MKAGVLILASRRQAGCPVCAYTPSSAEGRDRRITGTLLTSSQAVKQETQVQGEILPQWKRWRMIENPMPSPSSCAGVHMWNSYTHVETDMHLQKKKLCQLKFYYFYFSLLVSKLWNYLRKGMICCRIAYLSHVLIKITKNNAGMVQEDFSWSIVLL